MATEFDARAKDVDLTRQPIEDGSTGDNKVVPAQGHVFLVADLVQAIKDNRDPSITGRSARKAVDLILAIYESARRRRDVAVVYG